MDVNAVTIAMLLIIMYTDHNLMASQINKHHNWHKVI